MSKRVKIILISVAATVFATAVVLLCVFLIKPYEPPAFQNGLAIYGAKDTQVLQGKYFDYYYGVTAVSESGEDFTDSLVVTGDLNTSKAGDYELTYSVSDTRGNTASVTRKITVVKNEAIGYVKPVPEYTVPNGNYNIAEGCEAYAGTASIKDERYAFDGDMETRWESEWTNDVYLTVNLRAVLPVEKVEIYWEAAYATDFSLLVSSDGSIWRNVATVEGQQLTGGLVNEFTFNDVEAQYIRLHCTNRAQPAYGYSIWEFKVMGPRGTVVPEEFYPCLFDAKNDKRDDWAIDDLQTLVFDLGAEKKVNRIRILYDDNLTPALYNVYYALSDGNYKQIKKLYNLPYSGDWFRFEDGVDLTVEARYFKIELVSRRFFSSAYRINEAAFVYYDENADPKETKHTATVTADGNGAEFMLDGDEKTYWESPKKYENQTIDLGGVKSVGRVDLFWRGDDGGKGKYYDLQISSDGENWETVFRQTHGAEQTQSIYVYEDAQYIRVIDYQNPSDYRYMLEGIAVQSPYPESSGEGKVEYDVLLKFPEWKIETYGKGSYATGGTDFTSARLVAYIDDSLRGKPIPSNDWWQGLLIRDKGYNMFTYPLMATFKTDGLWLTNPGGGYFDGFVPGNGSHTVDVDAHDISIGYDGCGADSKVRVTGYSDYGITTVMTDNAAVDKMTAYLSQGSLYGYFTFAEPEKVNIGYYNLVAVYDLYGNKILTEAGSSFTGDGIVVCVKTHSNYKDGVKKYKKDGEIFTNEEIYEERYYVVSTPQNTEFVLTERNLSVKMTEGNYMSVGAVAQANAVSKNEISDAEFPLKEVEILHRHGYAFVMDTSCTYSFDEKSNEVTTKFALRTVCMRSGYSAEAYSAYLPHQLSKSSYKGGYVYKSVRGDIRSHEGNEFITKDKFYGAVPTFVEPTDDGYSAKALYELLLYLFKQNNFKNNDIKDIEKTLEGNYLGKKLIAGDPYWQGKNLHPMAMAALAADQIGAIDLRDKFLDKVEYILEDWFTYDEEDDKIENKHSYLYYDSEWGTLYYKNSEFGAGVNLADHYFTFGYYTFAAGVLTSFRPDFAKEWGNMIELLIRDYMNPDRNDPMFPYMRNFDPFAGHGWAGGYADNNGGNNQESAGEALNSWVGAYLYATAVGNEKIRRAAIYGYTTELNAIKHYWFDYFGDFPESYPYGVAGQVYGGSNFFGTFFNGEPLYMYGIHLVPGEEFLTSYGLNDEERKALKKLIEKMKAEQSSWDTKEEYKEIHDYRHIFIPIVAIYDADEAIKWYNDLNGDVGNKNEEFNVYWLIHGMKSTGVRTTDIWAENGATATVYVKDGAYTAICWNPTDKEVEYTFRNANGVVGSVKVPAHSLVSCNPVKTTVEFTQYFDGNDFDLTDYAETENATAQGGSLVFGKDGKVTYLLTFGSEEAYYKVKISTVNSDVSVNIDGEKIPLERTADGWGSKPVLLDFKHTVQICASDATISGFVFEKVELKQISVASTVTASSVKDNNYVSNIMDGDKTTRWESSHGPEGVKEYDAWLTIAYDEPVDVNRMRIDWEEASAEEYKVYFSLTGNDGEWTEVYHGNYTQAIRTDVITFPVAQRTKYIKLQFLTRIADKWGYSILEIELYNFDDAISYKDFSDFNVGSPDELDGATAAGGAVNFGADGGSVTYRIDFGSEDAFYKLKISGGDDLKVMFGGKELQLEKVDGGWESKPFAVGGKHALIFSGSGTVSGLDFEKLTLKKLNVTADKIEASSEKDAASNAFDGVMTTRWESQHGNDNEWLQIKLSAPTEVNRIKIYWEGASATEYKIFVSETGADDDWDEVAHITSSDGKRDDEVTFENPVTARYIKIQGIKRKTEWGYSIYEIELYNFSSN